MPGLATGIVKADQHRMLSLAVAVSGIVAVAGHYAGDESRWLVYLFKPLTTSLLLALALAAPPPALPRYRWAIAAGLLFSLAGDVFLMLPADLFLAGLASFFVTHLCYLTAFTADASRIPRRGALLLAVAGAAVVWIVWPGLRPGLRLPVVLYAAVLVAMAVQARGWALALGRPAPRLAAAGALLFVLSDSLLAIDRFRFPFVASRAAVLTTYFAAQWLIASSVWAAEEVRFGRIARPRRP